MFCQDSLQLLFSSHPDTQSSSPSQIQDVGIQVVNPPSGHSTSLPLQWPAPFLITILATTYDNYILVQLDSSDRSPQSLSPSHCHELCMQ